MLMDRRARVELVMCECHAWRVEIAASPAWQTFDSGQFVGIDEWHVSNPQRCVRILRQAECDHLAARTREAAAHQQRTIGTPLCRIPSFSDRKPANKHFSPTSWRCL